MHAGSLRLVAIIGIALLAATTAGAAEPAPAGHAGLSDAGIDRRIEFLEQKLDDSRTHGQIWYWSWLTINGGSTIGNGIAAGLSGQHDDRINAATEAVMGAIGVADLLLRPLEARSGAAPIRGLPDATRAQKLIKLRAAEDQLRGNALRAEGRTQVLPYAGNAVLALAAGLVVGLWGERGAGIQTGLSNLFGGILYVATEPARPARDWQDYRALTGRRAAGVDVDVVLATFADGGRIDLRLRW